MSLELYAWVEDLERLGGCEKGQWHEGPACRRRFFPYRIARSVPLTAARRVGGTVVEVWEHDRRGQQLYHNAWFTDLEVTADKVAAIVRIGRSRWKIENEQCNVQKNHGYELEHNYGHGQQTLSMVSLPAQSLGLHRPYALGARRPSISALSGDDLAT